MLIEVQLAFLAIETILWNLVDSSAGVVPVTKVDSIEDTLTKRWGKEQPKGAKILHKAVYSQAKGIYDAKKMAGLPVGVQVVCSAWEEERVSTFKNVEAQLTVFRHWFSWKFWIMLLDHASLVLGNSR